jgi:hypothetical protein
MYFLWHPQDKNITGDMYLLPRKVKESVFKKKRAINTQSAIKIIYMYKIKVSEGTTNTWKHLVGNPVMN